MSTVLLATTGTDVHHVHAQVSKKGSKINTSSPFSTKACMQLYMASAAPTVTVICAPPHGESACDTPAGHYAVIPLK